MKKELQNDNNKEIDRKKRSDELKKLIEENKKIKAQKKKDEINEQKKIRKEKINENMNELNYFDKEKPYTLGKIQLRTDKKIEYLTNWKDKTFYISRMNKKYTYPNILNNEKKGKYCGHDSNGNKLYFPLNVECPINYIEFTHSQSPSLKEYN